MQSSLTKPTGGSQVILNARQSGKRSDRSQLVDLLSLVVGHSLPKGIPVYSICYPSRMPPLGENIRTSQVGLMVTVYGDINEQKRGKLIH